MRFAAAGRPRGPGAFCDVPHRMGDGGVPILEGVAAFVECQTITSHDVGDHSVFVARVTGFDACESAVPLIFHGGRYARLAS